MMLRRRTQNAQSTIQGNRNCSSAKRGRRRPLGKGSLPRVQDIGCDLLQLENEVRRDGDFGYSEVEGTDRREPAVAADVPRGHKYADLSLKLEALKPAAKRELVDFAQQAHGLSQRAACEMLNLSRSVYRYEPDTNRDLPVIAAIQAVLKINPGYGFGKLFKTMRQ